MPLLNRLQRYCDPASLVFLLLLLLFTFIYISIFFFSFFLTFLFADCVSRTCCVGRSVGRSVGGKRHMSVFRSCPPVRDWGGVYTALFFKDPKNSNVGSSFKLNSYTCVSDKKDGHVYTGTGRNIFFSLECLCITNGKCFSQACI